MKRWLDAALKNCDWALTQQTSNGWFSANAFADDEVPLLHNIGYVLEGILGVGEVAQRDRYIQAAIDGTRPLVDIFRSSGVLRGRYDRHWRPAVSWRCLTGEAQIAIVMFRLARITGREEYGATRVLLGS